MIIILNIDRITYQLRNFKDKMILGDVFELHKDFTDSERICTFKIAIKENDEMFMDVLLGDEYEEAEYFSLILKLDNDIGYVLRENFSPEMYEAKVYHHESEAAPSRFDVYHILNIKDKIGEEE